MRIARGFRWSRLLAVLAGVPVAAHAGLWFYATRRLANDLVSWQAQARAAGWAVTTGPVAATGWPLAATLSIADVTVGAGAADPPGPASWQAGRVELSVGLLHPGRLRITTGGQQHLHLPGVPDIGFTADRFDVTVPLGPAPSADRGDLAVAGLRADLPTGELRIPTLAMRGGFWESARRGEPALAITASADAIVLPPLPAGRAWPFGPRIASVSFDAALTGPLPAASTGPAASALTAAATSWRDSGGTLDVRRLVVGWGQLGLSANGTLQLDEHLQPLGYATARVVGTDATLAALAASGVLPARSVQAVRGVLTLLVRTPEGGGAPQVDLPVLLQERTVVVGGYPLLRLPEWRWP